MPGHSWRIGPRVSESDDLFVTEERTASVRVGVEIGGTFTDLVAIAENGAISTCKVLSVPSSPAHGALAALDAWGEPLGEVEVLVHGSTIATNTVLERTGATTALIVTKGFRDVLEIQRHERTRVYDLYYQKAVPIVPRYLVLEADERIAADGSVVRPLEDTGSLLRRLARLREAENVESVTVVLLNSYRNAVHEEALGKAIREAFPKLPVTLSAEVLPQFREYERASTTVMSAYLKPVIQRYMDSLQQGLAERAFDGDLHIMQSNGGIFPVAAAQRQAVNVILSGPAAGVVGAARVGAAAGHGNLITLDMGGTSTDVCLVHDGKPRVTADNQIDGLPIVVPMVEIITVGAGGGPIAYVDPGGMLKVGPGSAGADPGPSCYGRRGGRPTVTDANVLCGLIRPEKFFGGNLQLRPDLASTALSVLARKLGMDTVALAEGIIRVANSNMMDAIRLASLERGHDPRDYTLVAFGGAGGLHACSLAEDLEIGSVLVPRNPGLLSAYGLLVSEFRREFVRTELTRNADVRSDRVLHVFAELEDRGRQEFERYHVSRRGLVVTPSVDLRYLGQDLDLNVEVDRSRVDEERLNPAVEAFHRAYDQRCGHRFPDAEVEVVNYRLTVSVPNDAPPLRADRANGSANGEAGAVYTGGRWVECAYFERQRLPVGFSASGPMVVEEATATTFVPPGWTASVDSQGNLVLTSG